MVSVMYWLPVIAVLIIDNVMSQECASESGNPMQVKCYTEWSKWTSCVSPFSNMDEAISEYKREIRAFQCREPLAFWAATINSKMMKHRKTLPDYRKKMGIQKRKILRKVTNRRGENIMKEMKGYGNRNSGTKSNNAPDNTKGSLLLKAKKRRYLELNLSKAKLKTRCEKILKNGSVVMPPEFYDLLRSMGMTISKNKMDGEREQWMKKMYRPEKPNLTGIEKLGQSREKMEKSVLAKTKMKRKIKPWIITRGNFSVFPDKSQWAATWNNSDGKGREEYWRILMRGYKTMLNGSSTGFPSTGMPNSSHFEQLKQILLTYKNATIRMVNMSVDLIIMTMTNRSFMEDMIERSLKGETEDPAWLREYMTELEELSEKSVTLLTQAGILKPEVITELSSKIDLCPAKETVDNSHEDDENACDKLFQLMIMEYETVAMEDPNTSEESLSAVDTDEPEYEAVEAPDQPSVGCGFCARRLRCCRDEVFSWMDQDAESQPCEEYSSACEVPPLSDGTCNFDKYMPKFKSRKIADSVHSRNRQLAAKIESKIRNKWMQYLGSLEPQMNCQMKDDLCYCCCGNYTVAEDRLGYFTCRYSKNSGHIPDKPTQRPRPTIPPRPEPSPTTKPKPQRPWSKTCQEVLKPWSYPKGCSEDSCHFIVSWKPNVENNHVTFEIIAKVNANLTRFWTGIGAGPEPSMETGDVLLVKVTPEAITVHDGYLQGYKPPGMDESQDIVLEQSKRGNGYVAVTMTRNCATGDNHDRDLCSESVFFMLPVSGGKLSPDNDIWMHYETPKTSFAKISLKPCFVEPIPVPRPDPILPKCVSGNWTEFSFCSPSGSDTAGVDFVNEVRNMGCKVVTPNEVFNAQVLLRQRAFQRTKRETEESSSFQRCGHCSARVRCCQDATSWIDQAIEMESCEEYVKPCEYPIWDGGCKKFERLMLDAYDVANEITGNLTYKLQVVGRLMQDAFGEVRVGHNCLNHNGKCHCCCLQYYPVLDGDEVICSDTPPEEETDSDCTDSEEYRSCSNGCEGSCDDPNPVCIEMCSDTFKGCYCKPGLVRYGRLCIQPDHCPKFVDPIHPTCSLDDKTWSDWSECIPTSIKGGLALTFDWIEKLRSLNCAVVTPVSIQLYFATIPDRSRRTKRQAESEQFCGYCSTRLRCCQDSVEWHLQATEKDVCTDPGHSAPCEVNTSPDVADCDFNELVFPDFAEMFQAAVVPNDTFKAQIIGKLDTSNHPIPDPSFNCIKHKNKCFCCCHEYVPVIGDSGRPECHIQRKI